jgi:glutamate racemase
LIKSPIGLFDSGIGGLSILREVHRQFPSEHLLYLADQAHVPYGSRSLEQVRQISFGIVTFLLEQGAKLITVACNTASAASLHNLRERFPQVPFVGMEPAVKPAAANTQSHTVGVLATPATFQGALFSSVVERFAEGVTILQEPLPGLVQQIEKGEVDGPATRAILEEGVLPLLDQGADTLVLACTHYPLIIPLLLDIVGEEIQVIDPSPAIARQVGRLLDQHGLFRVSSEEGSLRYITTGDLPAFESTMRKLGIPRGEVLSAQWDEELMRLS